MLQKGNFSKKKVKKESKKNIIYIPRYTGLSDVYSFSINVSFGTKPAMASLFDGFTSVCPRYLSDIRQGGGQISPDIQSRRKYPTRPQAELDIFRRD